MENKKASFGVNTGRKHHFSHQFLNWWPQHPTGVLHFCSSSPFFHRKTAIANAIAVFLVRENITDLNGISQIALPKSI